VANLKRILIGFTLLGLLLSPLSGAAPAAAQSSGPSDNQFTQMDTVNTDWQIDQTIPESYEKTAENDTYILYVDHATLGFKVVDKRSGYVWHATLDQKQDSDRLNKSWEAFAKSGISIDYLDQKAASKRLSITTANHDLTVNPIDQGIEVNVTFKDPSITLRVILKLEPSGVSVEVPFESIQQNDPAFKLGMVHIYPFFGATRADSVPGYMFIPDGSGSLIRFAAETKARNILSFRYYGQDLGMLGIIPWDAHLNPAYEFSLPVIGMVHGYKQNAYLAVIEKGAPYAEVQAHPSGIITNFNFLYNSFIYNESYFQPTNKAGDGVNTIQPNTNHFDVRLHYRFLTKDDSDYVGMAKDYQRYLIETGVLKKQPSPTANIGVKLEFLGAEKEKVLLWNRSIALTSISQMEAILKDLNIPNAQVVYYGWQPLGASTMPPRSLKIESSLGEAQQLQDLAKQLQSTGGNLFLYADPQAAFRDESGYSARYDLAMAITIVNVRGFNRGEANYYMNVNAVNDHYTPLSQSVFDQKLGLAVDELGYLLYSDFKKGNFVNREMLSSATVR